MMKKPRRKRSELTHGEAVKAVEEWAGDIQRMLNTSEKFDGVGEAERDLSLLTYKFQVRGKFTTHQDFFEAIRVLGGHKLPAKG